MYQQLEVAQRIGDQRRVANAYNNLANMYFETGDYDRAIEMLHHNLEIAGEIGYERIVCLSLLNLAEAYLLAGDGEQALENGLRGLRVSQETGFELFEVYAFHLIGKSYMKLGSPSQAIHTLEQALALSVRLESKVTESLILLSLGEVYRDMQQFDRRWHIFSRLSPLRSQSMPGVSYSKAICFSLKSISSRGIWPQRCIISKSIMRGAREFSMNKLTSDSKSCKWPTIPRHPSERLRFCG